MDQKEMQTMQEMFDKISMMTDGMEEDARELTFLTALFETLSEGQVGCCILIASRIYALVMNLSHLLDTQKKGSYNGPSLPHLTEKACGTFPFLFAACDKTLHALQEHCTRLPEMQERLEGIIEALRRLRDEAIPPLDGTGQYHLVLQTAHQIQGLVAVVRDWIGHLSALFFYWKMSTRKDRLFNDR